MNRNADFVRELATLSPQLSRLMKVHLEDFDELLPHLYMADVERHAEDLWTQRVSDTSGGAQAELQRIIEKLEEGFITGDPDLHDLIAASFLEHLPHLGEPGADLRSAFGPSIRAFIEEFG